MMGIAGSAISIAEGFFRGADDQSVRNLLETIFERIKRTPDLINPSLLLETVKSLAYSVLGTVFGAVGSISSIREAVFRNEINATTLILIRDKAGELAKFILDLVEVAKCYCLADGTQRGLDDEYILYTEFNELDFSQNINRYAAICQIQRLALSIIYIIRHLFTPVAFKDIYMSDHTNLQSDRGIGLQETYPRRDSTQPNAGGNNKGTEGTANIGEGTQPNAGSNETREDRHNKKLNLKEAAIYNDNKKWLFVNGIGRELFWLQLAYNKLRAIFHRNITGVFNRGDGLLWDIIECAGQRSLYV
jgi:hypothetical protein